MKLTMETSMGHHVETDSATLTAAARALGVDAEYSAEDLLARIGALQREASRLDKEIALAKARLERSREYLTLRGLREDRKEALAELNDVLGETLAYAQARRNASAGKLAIVVLHEGGRR